MNKVAEERITELMTNAVFEDATFHGKVYVLSCKLPNGFVITESSACVDVENFDESIGRDICLNRIIDKVWELEGYLLQNNLAE